MSQIQSSGPVIEVQDLRKVFRSVVKQPGLAGTFQSLVRPKYAEKAAVKGISLTLQQGEMVGFLGPNGAGKTTTLKMLSGILYPTSGTATILGHVPWKRDPDMLRQISLVMGNKQQLWWDLPAMDSFIVLKEIYDVPEALFKSRLDALTETLSLTGLLETQVRKLSLGERMKCELVAALLHGPKVIFLDEPTLGLDVVSQQRIRDFLREFHRTENCTVLLTSHYMQDVQELCDRVVIIDHGGIVFEGSLEALSDQFQDSRRVRLVLGTPADSADLARFGTVAELNGNVVSLDVKRSEVAAAVSGLLTTFQVVDLAIEEVEIDQVLRDLFTRDVSRETLPSGEAKVN